tara:strand:+ start:834 stop:1880 length:1047 start_codon:yes stop_codon:yes gene_type:complete
MSINWDNLIESHFKNKNKINFCTIVEMVQKQMENSLLQEKGVTPLAKARTGLDPVDAAEERRGIPYPQLRITNDWGKPGSQQRDTVDMFVRRIQAADASNTIQGRLVAMADFTSSCTSKSCQYQTIPDVLSFITLLDAFSAIRYQFEAQASGWMFESFIAAIIGGTQETEASGASLPIEDVVLCTSFEDEGGEACLEKKAFSLKFVGKAGGQGGTNVALLNQGIKNFGSVEYIIGAKRSDGVDFYTVEISNENFDQVVNVGSNGKNWSINKAALSAAIPMDLPTEEQVRATAESALGVLGAGVDLLYANLDNLSHFLTEYFVAEDKSAALKARNESMKLKANVDEYIK